MRAAKGEIVGFRRDRHLLGDLARPPVRHVVAVGGQSPCGEAIAALRVSWAVWGIESGHFGLHLRPVGHSEQVLDRVLAWRWHSQEANPRTVL